MPMVGVVQWFSKRTSQRWSGSWHTLVWGSLVEETCPTVALTVVGVFGLFSVNAPVLVEDGDIWVILDSSMIYHQCTHIQCINGEFSNLATDLEILEWVSIYCCTCRSCPEILPSSFALPLFLCILRQPSNWSLRHVPVWFVRRTAWQSTTRCEWWYRFSHGKDGSAI